MFLPSKFSMYSLLDVLNLGLDVNDLCKDALSASSSITAFLPSRHISSLSTAESNNASNGQVVVSFLQVLNLSLPQHVTLLKYQTTFGAKF